MDGKGEEMAARGSYPNEYYRLLSLGSVDHNWVDSIFEAAKAGNEAEVQRLIEERGFTYRPEMLDAIRGIDLDSIRAVVEAFGGEIHPALIC